MLFNLNCPENTSQLSRKLKLQTKSCEILGSAEFTCHVPGSAPVVHTYEVAVRTDRSRADHSISRRRNNKAGLRAEESIPLAAKTVVLKRSLRQLRTTVDLKEESDVKIEMPSSARPRSQPLKDHQTQQQPQRADSTQNSRQRSVRVRTKAPSNQPAPDQSSRQPHLFRDLFSRRRNDPPSTTSDPSPREHHDGTASGLDRRKSTYRSANDNLRPTSEPFDVTSSPTSRLPSRDGSRSANTVPIPRQPAQHSQGTVPRSSNRRHSMIPDTTFADDAEFQLFADATAGLGGFDEPGFRSSPSRDASSQYLPSQSNRRRRGLLENPEPFVEEYRSGADYRRGAPGEFVSPLEYLPITPTSSQHLAQIPQATTTRRARAGSRPASTIFTGAAVVDIDPFMPPARPTSTAVPTIERSSRTRMTTSPRSRGAVRSMAVGYDDSSFGYGYDDGRDFEGREVDFILDEEDELDPDDELPDYAQSQAQAQAHQRIEATRRAQELAMRWHLSGSRRGG